MPRIACYPNSMSWLQLKLQTSPEQAPRLSDLLSAAGAMAVTLEDAADEPLYEPPPGSQPLWSHATLSGLFEAAVDVQAVLDELRAELGGTALPPFRVEALEQRDWQRECQQHFQPRCFGDRLWVCPSWHEPPESAGITVRLDPGLAFGTGSHPTTALCLEWLAGADIAEASVIDYGCGSGILAIAAAKLGAAEVWAVDIDPQALQATADNARANGVAASIRAVPPEALPALQAQVLVANILAGPLVALAPRFAQLVRTGGRIALSGILAEQAAEVCAAYMPLFILDPVTESDGWGLVKGMHR
jgi:ribosomal protein L11 methyltransferase